MTRKCTFEYCTRPNSSHTTEQCWDRKAIEEQFQAAKQQRQQYAPSRDYNAPQQQHRVQQQQYSSYGAYSTQQHYAPSNGSAVQQQHAQYSQYGVHQPGFYGGNHSQDARQPSMVVQHTSASYAYANYSSTHTAPAVKYGGVPSGGVPYGGVAYGTTPPAAGTQMLYQRPDYGEHVGVGGTSGEPYGLIGNINSGNIELGNTELNTYGITGDNNCGTAVLTTELDTHDSGVANTYEPVGNYINNGVSADGDHGIYTDNTATTDGVSDAKLTMANTTTANTDNTTTADDTGDDTLTNTTDTTTDVGNNGSHRLTSATNPTTTITELSLTTGNYSDSAVNHLTKLRHHAYPELSLVRYDTTMVNFKPVTDSVTLSENVAPPDGCIQTWSNDLSTDTAITTPSVSTTPTIASETVQSVTDSVVHYEQPITTEPVRAPNTAAVQQYDSFFTEASQFGGVAKTIDGPHFTVATVKPIQTCSLEACMTSGIDFRGLMVSLCADLTLTQYAEAPD